MKIKTYIVFIIQAYDKKLDDGTLLDIVEIQLIDTSLESAIKRSKGIIKKENYRLKTVIEKEGGV